MSQIETKTSVGRIYQFPNAAWCRLGSGVFSNQVTREAPNMAHALLVEKKDGTFQFGVRVSIAKPQDAEELWIKFSLEGGGSAFAGTNNLSPEEADRFYDEFDIEFSN